MNTKKLALLGSSINYSLSPLLHNFWLKLYNINATYSLKDVDINWLSKNNIKSLFKNNNYVGLNVTIPYKEKILPFVDDFSPAVKRIKSANTLYYKDNKIFADNTDVKGFIKALLDKIKEKPKDIIIMGAGGAARSVIYGLSQIGAVNFYIKNRTQSKINKLIEDFTEINIKNIKYLDKKSIDLVVNTLPIDNEELFSSLPLNKLKKECLFFDLKYKQNNLFLNQAKQAKFKYLNGISMLVYQGAESFKLWFNINPKVNDELFNLINLKT